LQQLGRSVGPRPFRRHLGLAAAIDPILNGAGKDGCDFEKCLNVVDQQIGEYEPKYKQRESAPATATGLTQIAAGRGTLDRPGTAHSKCRRLHVNASP